jgi:hypothetical protein
MFLKPILNSKLKQYMINFGLLAAFRCFSLLFAAHIKNFRTFLSIESEYVGPSAAADFAC